MALAHCILGKFFGVGCHCFPPPLDVPTQLILEECGQCLVFASFTVAFALQLMKKHGKTSVRVAEECTVTD
jgi:hypothetical protein